MKTRMKLSLMVGLISLTLMAGLIAVSLLVRSKPLTWSPVPSEAVVLALVTLASGILLAIVARFFQRLMAMVQDLHDR